MTMSDEAPAAILATYADYRRIPTRKVLRLILEVPIEHEAETFQKIGFPGSHGDVWCAIARTIPPQERTEPPPKPSHAVREAGILCGDPEFWEFLTDMWGTAPVESEAVAASYVRKQCGVESRRDITPGSEAEKRWGRLILDYGQWRTVKNWPAATRGK